MWLFIEDIVLLHYFFSDWLASASVKKKIIHKAEARRNDGQVAASRTLSQWKSVAQRQKSKGSSSYPG